MWEPVLYGTAVYCSKYLSGVVKFSGVCMCARLIIRVTCHQITVTWKLCFLFHCPNLFWKDAFVQTVARKNKCFDILNGRRIYLAGLTLFKVKVQTACSGEIFTFCCQSKIVGFAGQFVFPHGFRRRCRSVWDWHSCVMTEQKVTDSWNGWGST